MLWSLLFSCLIVSVVFSVLFTDVLLIKCEFYVRDLSRKLPAILYYVKITYPKKWKLIYRQSISFETSSNAPSTFQNKLQCFMSGSYHLSLHILNFICGLKTPFSIATLTLTLDKARSCSGISIYLADVIVCKKKKNKYTKYNESTYRVISNLLLWPL